MTIHDNNAKIYFIGVEHLKRKVAAKLLRGETDLTSVTLADVNWHTKDNFAKLKKPGYLMVLYMSGKNKVLTQKDKNVCDKRMQKESKEG